MDQQTGTLYYEQAGEHQAEAVYRLVQDTILKIYPKFYREEIVDFFRKLHSLENITQDIRKGQVYVMGQQDGLIGTGSLSGNHITRVYVSPAQHGKGYGRFIMERLEREIAENYPSARLDASLPACQIYEHCGYRTVSHERYPLENGVVLIYEVMEKAVR